MSATFRAGAAKREITPPAGTSLGGFIARLGVSTGHAEPMHVRAMVASLGDRVVAVVAADVLGFGASQVDAVRRFASDRLGLRSEQVLLSATHTHSGPSIILVRGCPLVPDEYQRFLVHSMQTALDEAHAAQAPASLEIGSCPFALGVNRRQNTPDGVILGVAPDKPRPTRLHMAAIQTPQQRILLLSYACHPYVLGGDSLLASGDFPSMACLELERDSGTVAMYLNGCAGDIAATSAFEGLVRARAEGVSLAESVRATLNRLERHDICDVSGNSSQVRLPHQPLPTEREVDEIAAQAEHVVRPAERHQPEIQRKRAVALDEWSRLVKRVVRRELPLEPVTCEIQALHLGPLTLLGIAGEPFFSLGEDACREAPGGPVWPLGYTNTYCGYIPTLEEFPLGGYEVNDAWRYVGLWKIQDSSGSIVVQAAKAMLAGR